MGPSPAPPPCPVLWLDWESPCWALSASMPWLMDFSLVSRFSPSTSELLFIPQNISCMLPTFLLQLSSLLVSVLGTVCKNRSSSCVLHHCRPHTLLVRCLLWLTWFWHILGLRFCARAFSSCGKRGPLFIAMRGPLTVAEIGRAHV